MLIFYYFNLFIICKYINDVPHRIHACSAGFGAVETDSSIMCPCGAPAHYRRCCRPLHLGATKAPTPAALVRARFAAYARGDASCVKFLVDTTDARNSAAKARRSHVHAASRRASSPGPPAIRLTTPEGSSSQQGAAGLEKDIRATIDQVQVSGLEILSEKSGSPQDSAAGVDAWVSFRYHCQRKGLPAEDGGGRSATGPLTRITELSSFTLDREEAGGLSCWRFLDSEPPAME